MADDQRFHSFKEFYPFYLSEHANRTSRRLHFVGTSIACLLLAASLLTQRWWLMAVAAAQGYATDPTNGSLLWEAVDKRGGTTALAENTLNTWLDVDHAFEAWSEQLASRLQELGACQR